MSKPGLTTGNVKLRTGPGTEFEPPIAFVETNTTLEILEEQEHWLKVRVKVKDVEKEGYVTSKYVKATGAEAAPAPAAPATSVAPSAAPADKGGPIEGRGLTGRQKEMSDAD